MGSSTDMFQKHIGTFQNTERSPIINRLPDEVLLDIFDSYRRNIIDKYDHYWRKNYAWFNLAHVCRKWRAVMFASASRLDLNVVVGPAKPGDIKTILSGHLPILIDYSLYEPKENSGSALWRMRAALKHRDRVRGIIFQAHIDAFRKFIMATNYHFPVLESLFLFFPQDYEPGIPTTFLRGPDRSDIPLRRLGLYGGSNVCSISGLLSSTTALTDLTLNFTTSNHEDFDSSQASSLLACLQGMQRLRNLNLTTPHRFLDCLSESQYSPLPKDIATVPMSELTRFYYSGPNRFLNDLMSELSAPSLQDVCFEVCAKSPLPYLSQVIDDAREEFRSVSVAFDRDKFHLVLSTYLGEIDHFKPSKSSFRFSANCPPGPHSINSMRNTPSTKLAMVEELTLNFPSSDMTGWENVFPIRDFLCLFRSVRLLRVNPFVREIGIYLKQDEDGKEAIFPALEEIEISILSRYSPSEEYRRRAVEAMATFVPLERAGRWIKVSHCKQSEKQSRNARNCQW